MRMNDDSLDTFDMGYTALTYSNWDRKNKLKSIIFLQSLCRGNNARRHVSQLRKINSSQIYSHVNLSKDLDLEI